MRIAVYGLPSSGKTTLMKGISSAKIINGRQVLECLSDGKFSFLSEEEKRRIRELYTKYLAELDDDVIVSDGHYSFMDNIVFTPNDGDIYDVIFYLYCSPSELKRRFDISEKNQKYSSLSVEAVTQWQSFEIESLREECHKRNKDFYVISDNGMTTCFYSFFDMVVHGYSTYKNALAIARRISEKYPLNRNKELYITDGDKTIIEQDSFRFCYNGKTNVFDGDFYTGYQSYLFSKELTIFSSIPQGINDINLNEDVWGMISNTAYVVISSGITSVWNRLQEKYGFVEVIADPMISADTKYYVVKILKGMGYSVTAFGDSKNDYYMLKESDCGYLKIGKHISRSLVDIDLTGLCLLYDKEPYYLIDEATQDDLRDIYICKSNSGINGSRLAAAHLRLGQRLGQKMARMYPSKNTAVLVLERGGRFFGDGVYSTFGGVFYPYNSSVELMPDIIQTRVVIVDSVINTGKSVLNIISRLKSMNPDVEIVIASNVIQDSAVKLLSDYKVCVVRGSSNSFVGKRQAIQIGKSGPDTADRLFNIIDRSF